MTVNSTVTFFLLGRFMHLGSLKYVYFALTAVTFVSDIFFNTCVIVVICMNRSLHEPMYLLLCNLFVNELCLSAGFFPLILVQILSDVHTVSVPFCFLQIIVLHVYATIEILNLAVMSYDRYLAICCPLQYNSRMTTSKVLAFITGMWLYSVVKVLITVSLNIRLKRCKNVIDHFYCKNHLVLKLACSDTTVNNIYGLWNLILAIVIPLLPILISYTKILRVCFSGSGETRRKALSTCSPQLASLLNFSFGCLFDILHGRFSAESFPTVLHIVLSLNHIITQPLLSPIMFGFKLTKIRNALKDTFHYNRLPEHRGPM